MSEYGAEEDDKAAGLQDFLDFKDAMIYLIDVSPSMLKETDEDDSVVYSALYGAYMAITDRLMFSPLDMSCVLLYGTEESNNDRAPAHVYELMPLGLPDSKSLKELKSILEDKEEFEQLIKPCKKEERPAMADVLFFANQQYGQRAPRYFSRRLIIVTDEDEPYHNKESYKAAKTRATDLVQLDVKLKPILVKTEDRPEFDTRKFYDELTLVPASIAHEFDETDELETYQPKEVLQECSLTSRNVRRKAEFTSTIELSSGLRFGVKGYLTMLHKRPQRSYWVYNRGEESKLVKTQSTPMNKESGRSVERDEVRKGYRFGDKLITLTPEQHDEIRQIDEPVIRIIGFKPIEAIKPRYNLTHARFIYPSDLRLSGSSRAFSCLHQSMIKKRRAAIAWCVLRSNNTPRLYALIPSQEEYRDMKRGAFAGKKIQYTADGFYLIQLPFRDDIRELPPSVSNQYPNEELVEAYAKIIESVRMAEGYSPERYANKHLEDFNRVLQAKALQEEIPEPFKDSTIPSYKSINKRIGGDIAQWNELLDKVARMELNKHPRASPEIEKPAKKPAAGPSVSTEQMNNAIMSGKMSKFTVAQLKQFAVEQKIYDGKSKKTDLMASIKTYLGNKHG